MNKFFFYCSTKIYTIKAKLCTKFHVLLAVCPSKQQSCRAGASKHKDDLSARLPALCLFLRQQEATYTLLLAIATVTLSGCQQDKRKVLYSEELQHEMSQPLIQLQIFMSPRTFIQSDSLHFRKFCCTHSEKKQNQNTTEYYEPKPKQSQDFKYCICFSPYGFTAVQAHISAFKFETKKTTFFNGKLISSHNHKTSEISLRE